MPDTDRTPIPNDASVVRGGAASSSDSDKKSLVGEVLAGRYRIDAELGSGGMGAVYRAEHVHMRKTVAVKVLHREMTYLPEVVARFEREAVAAARIEHPHVAAATDFGRLQDGSFYLVLEYVEGQSLRQLLDAGGPLTQELAIHVARQIAEALAAAHAAGIVHRDLKPDNVMLIRRDGDEHFVKVLDFGIAKVELGDAQSPLTQMGSVFGTPEYMAPEQAAGTPVDARADLYTLGIILYEMLTGGTPFEDDDLVTVLTRQMTMEPPPLPASVDPRVTELVMRLLANDPDRRPPSASDLLAQIDAIDAPTGAALALTPSPASTSPRSVAASTGDVAYGETVLSLPSAGLERTSPTLDPRPRSPDRRLFGTLFAHAPVLDKKVNLAGQPVPVWALGLAGLAAAALLFFSLFGGVILAHGVRPSEGEPARSGGGSVAGGQVPAPSEPLAVLLDKAAQGDRDAISKLQARPEQERSAAEWRALGRGYMAIGHGVPGLQAYKKALAIDPGLAKDRVLVADVAKAARTPATSNDALDLALEHLGATGADLVYDVWSKTRASRDDQEIAKQAKQRVDTPAFRGKASPALAIALDLGKGKTCSNFKELLPRVQQSADARSVPKLRSLTVRRGCGFLSLGDCFGCLRTGTQLEDAIKAAESRPAPSF
jgi:serine/threonine-protein kinase